MSDNTVTVSVSEYDMLRARLERAEARVAELRDALETIYGRMQKLRSQLAMHAIDTEDGEDAPTRTWECEYCDAEATDPRDRAVRFTHEADCLLATQKLDDMYQAVIADTMEYRVASPSPTLLSGAGDEVANTASRPHQAS